jgi:hypothetical protein
VYRAAPIIGAIVATLGLPDFFLGDYIATASTGRKAQLRWTANSPKHARRVVSAGRFLVELLAALPLTGRPIAARG